MYPARVLHAGNAATNIEENQLLKPRRLPLSLNVVPVLTR